MAKCHSKRKSRESQLINKIVSNAVLSKDGKAVASFTHHVSSCISYTIVWLGDESGNVWSGCPKVRPRSLDNETLRKLLAAKWGPNVEAHPLELLARSA